MQIEKTKVQKFKDFMSRYGYAIGVAFAVVVFTLIMVLATAVNSKAGNTGGGAEDTSSTITIHAPVLNASVYKGYDAKALMYNSTLKQWEAHKSIDFLVSAKSNVYAVLGGTVSEIYSNYLEGNVVVIQHENGLKSSYGSLESSTNLKVGDKVNAGDVIGTASETANRESGIGSYLHFTMYDEGGKKVDPSNYLNMDFK